MHSPGGGMLWQQADPRVETVQTRTCAACPPEPPPPWPLHPLPAELKQLLYALFGQFGKIIDVIAMRADKLRGQVSGGGGALQRSRSGSWGRR